MRPGGKSQGLSRGCPLHMFLVKAGVRVCSTWEGQSYEECGPRAQGRHFKGES